MASRTRLWFQRDIVLSLGLLCALSPSLAARDWASWRGPNHDGNLEAPGIFEGWDFDLETVWKRDLGSGYSGVSIAEGKLVTLHTDGVSDLLLAVDAETGKDLWSFRIGPMYRGHDGGHDGPVSTPVIDAGTVFALGADGRLVAVKLESGKLLWSRSLPEEVGAELPFWGFCTTPVVVRDLVVVQAGGGSGQSLVAFDRKSGSRRWSASTGRVEYRSPILAELHGVEQIVATTDREVTGVEPETGRLLWSFRFKSHNSSTPLAVGSDRLLLEGQSGVSLFRIPRKGRPERMWSSREFRRSYAVPVVYDGALYGYTERYLTCLDLETGKRRWRSRSPGGKGVIVVDGHLVLLGAKGDVVIAEADPRVFEEKARCSVSDADSYSWPSFAEGMVFVRNLKHLAAVKTVKAKAVVSKSGSPKSRFEEFVEKLRTSAHKEPLLDGFMSSQSSFPIVEGDHLVHFVYRGKARDVGISGTMIADLEEDEMERVEETDFFFRTYPIVPGARFEYRFNVDFGKRVLDPRNPRRVAGARGESSEVLTSSWKAPESFGASNGTRGKMETFRVSTSQHGSRTVEVYSPPGFEKPGRRRSVVIITEGDEWEETGDLKRTLDHLAAQGLDVPALAFLSGNSYRELGGATTHSFARMLARELVPELDRRLEIPQRPEAHVLFGKRAAAVAVVYATLAHPDVFGQCVALSYGRADTIRAQFVADRIRKITGPKPRFYLGWNRYEIWRPQSFDCREQSRDLFTDLEENGFPVVGGERLDSVGWVSWRILSAEGLRALVGSPNRRSSVEFY